MCITLRNPLRTSFRPTYIRNERQQGIKTAEKDIGKDHGIKDEGEDCEKDNGKDCGIKDGDGKAWSSAAKGRMVFGRGQGASF